MVDLADLHLNGEGGPRDHEMARQLFERAAKRGQGEAMFALGALYGGGHDIPPTARKRSPGTARAAEKGHPLAALMLGRYLRQGIATPVTRRGAQHGSPQAPEGGLRRSRRAISTRSQPPPAHPSDDISGGTELLLRSDANLAFWGTAPGMKVFRW